MQHAYRVPARHLPHLAANTVQNSDVIIFAIIYDIYKNFAIYIKQLNVTNKCLEWVSHVLDYYHFRTYNIGFYVCTIQLFWQYYIAYNIISIQYNSRYNVIVMESARSNTLQ